MFAPRLELDRHRIFTMLRRPAGIGVSRALNARLSVHTARFSTARVPDDDEEDVVVMRKAATDRATKDRPTSSRPGVRKEEMEEAAQKVQGGKSAWQRTVGGVVDTLRPMLASMAPVVMPLLDARHQRRVEEAANIDDLRIAAEKRAHAMVYGYLAGGADDERALRRSVAAYSDVELRHAVRCPARPRSSSPTIPRVRSRRSENVLSCPPFFARRCFTASGQTIWI